MITTNLGINNLLNHKPEIYIANHSFFFCNPYDMMSNVTYMKACLDLLKTYVAVLQFLTVPSKELQEATVTGMILIIIIIIIFK